MRKFEKLIDNKLIQNVFIWCCFFIILLGAVQAENKMVVSFSIILLLAPAIYINNLFILPKLKQQPTLFFFLFFINTIIFSVISVYLISRFANQEMEIKMFINFLGIMFLALAFGTATKLARDSFTRRQQEKEAQLKLLKAQLNPHFLFNTLNNLYGLSVLKSDKLPNLMLKLSDLLRYSLYDTQETVVLLEKELKYLENYVSLEKIRLEEKITISFTKSGTISSKKIAPMLLIVFVENAFKHLSTENNHGNVHINVAVTDDKMTFICTNTIDKIMPIKNMEKGKSGIGLHNAKKRLQLMYPEKHQLLIIKENQTYTVELTLIF
jgi:LytS/YehU family sensor histidine kinase